MPDRIYSIQYKGRIYDVRAADNVDPDALFRYVRQQVGGEKPQGPQEEENLLEKIPVVGDVLAGAADIPLNVVSGLAGTAKSLTDVFGADNVASEALEDVAGYAQSLTSAQSREDAKTAAAIRKEAEGKGSWEEAKAAARSFAVNPLDTLASAAGSTLPFALAAVTGGAPAAFTLAAASGVGTVKDAISDAVYTRAREAGVPEEQAKLMAEEAQAYGGENLDMQALGGVLAAISGVTGFDKQLARAIARRAIKDVVEEGVEQQVARGFARRTATGFGAEALPEAAQAGQERFAQNIAQQRAGYDTDLMSGVAGAAAFEGLAGGILGGTMGAVERGAPRPIATEEEILGEREALEAEIEATGIAEAQDPEIKTRAAEYMFLGYGPAEAVDMAVAQREKLRAAQQREEEAEDVVSGPDIGRGEPDISGIGGAAAAPEVAPAPTTVGGEPVGGTRVPAGQPVVSEGDVKPTLATAPIIPPIEEVSPQAQIAKQLAPVVEEAAPVAAAPSVTGLDEAGAGMAGAIGENLRSMLLAKVEAGEIMEGGQPSVVLQAAKVIKDAGVPVDATMLSNIQTAIDDARQTNNFQAAMRAFVADTIQRAAAAPDLNTQIDEYTSFVAKGQPAPAPLVESIARQYVGAMQTTGIEGLITPDRVPAFSQFVGNELNTVNSIIQEAAAAPAVEPAPVEVKPELPPEVVEAQAFVDQYNPGFEIRYNAESGRRRYSYGVPGGKVEFASTSLEAVKKRILNEKPLKPKKVIGGVPVKQMPPGKAGGLKQKPVDTEPTPKGPAGAGKLTPAQEQQQALLEEIDRNRRAKLIDDAQRSELIDMLRTPSPEEMDIYRRGLSDQEIAKRRALRSVWNPATRIQNEIDKLTAEGRALRKEEKLLEANEEIPAAAKKAKQNAFKKQAANIARRTKVQNKLLVEAKAGIYKAVRKKLAEAKQKPAKAKAELEKRLAGGEITKQQYDRMVRDLKPEPYMFRKGKGKAAGITLEELNAAVDSIVSKWGANLQPKVVQSIADLPPAIRKELETLGRTDAFGFYKDGNAYLIADNMDSIEDVAPTLYHEALGHLGLRKLFQDGLDAVLTDIHRTNPRVRQLADKWIKANPGLYSPEENPTARAVEEVLASASETGPLSAGRFDKLVKFLKDFARKYLGLDLKFSNREVRTLLAMAHEQVLYGEGTVMGSSSMMFNSPGQKKAKDTTADAEIDIEDIIEKVATTTADRIDPENYSRGLFANIGALLKGRSDKNWLQSLKDKNVFEGLIGRGGLKLLPTDGLLDYAKTKLGDTPTTAELRNAVDAADKMNGARATARRVLNRTVTDLRNYLASNGDSMVFQGKRQKALPTAMDYGNYYNMDMVAFTEAKTREDAFKTDAIWRKYNKLLQNTALDPKKKKDFEAKRTKREKEIEGGMRIWSNLSAQGRSLYKRVRDMHRRMQETREYYMEKRIEGLRDAGLSEEAVSSMMIAIRAEQERLNDRVNAPDPKDAHTDYPDVPLGLFHREYFPKRRYGKFWLRIKKTKFGEPILKFYEDMDERDADLKAFAEEMGVDLTKAESSNYFQTGNDVATQLGEDFDTEDPIIKALKLISDIDPETFTKGKQNQLRGDIYQLYLQNTPEGTGRKQFIKSKNRLGWSSDILRTTGITAEEYATDIARLRFAPDIDRALSAANSSIDSLSTNDQQLARDFISSVRERINGEMEPAPDGLVNKIVPWANQIAYISFLTAPATALVQVTALPIRVAPHLWGKYGMAATTRAMGRYMNVFNNLPRRESKAKAERKTFRIPTLMESSKVKGSPRHRDALTRATDEYGIIMPLSEFTMGEARTPETAAKGHLTETRQKAYDAMTYLFDASEQLTREVAFMAAYDLEYDKLADAKLSPEERQNKAIIAAKDTVNYTLGNYSNLNRPPIMKGNELARAFFLFKQYSVITTRFFVQATRAIFGKDTPRAERVAAMKEMTGVLGMSFLMGGVTALPLYTLGMMALQAMQDAFDDDEDRKERMRQNPLTADSVELQFRYEWLPQHFGQPMVTDDKGKQITLSDIILNGAVSEATGWNFGSRVSLDLAGMWFRSPKDADTWGQTINNALVENIPGASASLNIVSMGEEVAKGNVLKGLEVGLPAMLKAPFKAYRLETEGLRTQTEKIKLHNEEIENSAIIGAVLGFNPTKVAKVQQENRDVLNRTKELKEQKSELLGAYKRAVRRIQNGDADGREEAKKALDDIADFNRKVGNPYFGISYANIYKSLTGAEAEAKYDLQGMGLNEVESYYAQKMIGTK